MIALVAAGAALLWAGTPSVADAEQRAHAAALSHQSLDRGEAVPAKFAAALVATEDSRFSTHHGIDSIGVGRAVLGASRQNGDPGGSTLDQQLAKALYTNGGRSSREKVAQVTLAVKLDAAYAKPRLLEMYAQSVYFGHGFYGLHDAACGYFGLPPATMSWAQASLLAGLPQAPSSYDPFTHPELAFTRQRHVLDRLVDVGALSRTEADAVTPQAWGLSARQGRSGSGLRDVNVARSSLSGWC